MAEFWVYILECGDGTYYTGIANDVEKRLAEHYAGKRGAKYTRGRGPFKVLYREVFADKGAALRRELEIKAMSRRDKEKLIREVSAGMGKGSHGKIPTERGSKAAQDLVGDPGRDEGQVIRGETGTLYLCATPIGNLEDITIRGLKTLRSVDLIAAEDTRHTRKLLTHFHIHKPLTSYHEHNKKTKGPQLMEELLAGKNVALVSDAGMPGISDPGEDLVRLAVAKGITVVPIPGPTAGITALVISGLPTDKFVFEGFLPSQAKARQRRLQALAVEERTMIFYEAPHRLGKTLADMAQAWGPRQAAIMRELTKRYEEVLRGTLPQLAAFFEEQEPRGEFCLVVEGRTQDLSGQEVPGGEEIPQDPKVLVAKLMAQGLAKKEAVKEGAKILGLPKREVYKAVMVDDEDEL